MNTSKRKIELDILRGMAILLVLMRHTPIGPITHNIGWIGVDLFFVLSGYLISGLIFSEIVKTGKFDAKRFLIRRAFKIFPMFYLSLLIYIVFLPEVLDTNSLRIIADFVLIQNYVSGWGHIYPASWSIAVEEHFYLGLVLLILLLLKVKGNRYFTLSWTCNNKRKVDYFLGSIIFTCLFLRIISSVYFSELNARNFTMTHLRIDTLLSGVWLGYKKVFFESETKEWLKTHKTNLFVLALSSILWVPFIDPVGSMFAQTVGFLLTNITFTVIVGLTGFKIISVSTTTNIVARKMYIFLAFVGFSSYSIYLMHSLGNRAIEHVFNFYSINVDGSLELTYLLIISALFNILIGYIFTEFFENKLLSVRNKFFPSRSVSPIRIK